MDLEEAIALAQRCKDEGICSSSGKALAALLDELEQYRKIHPITKELIFKRLSKRNGRLPHHVESALRGNSPVYQD
jgi:hypothetical protein